jgi:hypothetical protein
MVAGAVLAMCCLDVARSTKCQHIAVLPELYNVTVDREFATILPQSRRRATSFGAIG